MMDFARAIGFYNAVFAGCSSDELSDDDGHTQRKIKGKFRWFSMPRRRRRLKKFVFFEEKEYRKHCITKRERIERNSEKFIGAALTGGRASVSNEVVDVLQVLVRLAVATNQP